MWDTMEDYAVDFIKARESNSFYGGRSPNEREQHRLEGIKDVLQGYRLYKARNILSLSSKKQLEDIVMSRESSCIKG